MEELLKYVTAVLAGAFTIGSICVYFLKKWFEKRESFEEESEKDRAAIRKEFNEGLGSVRREVDKGCKDLEERVNLFEREMGILTTQTVQNAASVSSLIMQIGALSTEVNNLAKTVIKQTTLLDERLPRKT